VRAADPSNSPSAQWLCCQLGAREHYAIPRALFCQGALGYFLTDIWTPPGNLLGILRRNLRERFHPDLATARVRACNTGLIAFELAARMRRLSGWPLILARNRWFQRKVASFLSSTQLSTLSPQRIRPTADNSQPTLFSYSYAALEQLRFAKSQGWKTILGQIDPGPLEEEIVAAEVARQRTLAPDWTPAPADYWKSWRKECDLADRIIVNSQWSFDAMVQTGIQKKKLSFIPLAFENNMSPVSPKEYPKRFTTTRPLRILFVGQINLRKGIARLLNAAQSLRSESVQFLLVGPIQINIPKDSRSNRKIQWVGPIARNKVQSYYEQADLFILPTLSDGFALTQLEALAHRLPVIASRQCGEVVIDHVNGLLLEEPTEAAIEEALRACLRDPNQLAHFSENATISEHFSLRYLSAKLCALAV
jgi:glycosyltransferase involved in cell wall biosynthesis